MDIRRLRSGWLPEERGQTTVEYAVATTFVIVVAVASFAVLRPAVLSFFAQIASQLSGLASGL